MRRRCLMSIGCFYVSEFLFNVLGSRVGGRVMRGVESIVGVRWWRWFYEEALR